MVDWSNQKPNANIAHFGKVSKLSYNAGRTLSPAVGGYVCVQPTQKLPKIISTSSSKASIAAIRSYFTDEQVMASGLLDAGRNALHEPDGQRHHPGESLGGVAYCSRKTTIETEELMRKKRILILTALVLLLCCAFSATAFAAGTGDVASAVESTWKTASGQIKTVVNNVVFPAIDLILAVFFFAKLGTAYFDYRKSGQFEWTAPAILFACLVFTLTAPLYIWQIIGI